MKHAVIRGHREHGHMWLVLKLISGFVAAALILMLAAAGAAGVVTGTVAVAAVEDQRLVETEDDAIESVTMTIELEEGGVIDVDLPGGDVTIDTWQGDEILLIVEKRVGSRVLPRKTPVSIEVIRRGRNIRIVAGDASPQRMADLGISFRILVPESDRGAIRRGGVKYSYSMAKLSSVLFRVLSKEALNWIAH